MTTVTKIDYRGQQIQPRAAWSYQELQQQRARTAVVEANHWDGATPLGPMNVYYSDDPSGENGVSYRFIERTVMTKYHTIFV